MGYVKEGQLINFQTPAVTNINSLKAYFKPKQAGTGDPSPSNVREITGWDGLSVTHCGKNLYDRSTSIKWYIPDKLRNELFYYSLYIDNTNGTTLSKPQLRAYDANDSYISSGTGSWGINTGETGRTYVAFSLSNLLNSDQIVSLSFNPSHGKSKAKEYMMSLSSDITYEPYNGTTTPIDWSSTAGTLYGGYVDLVSGEVVQTHKLLHFVKNYFAGITERDGTTYGVSGILSGAKSNSLFYCNKLSSKGIQSSTFTNDVYDGFISSDPRLVFALPPEITTLEQLKDWIDEIGGFDVVYELATPITYSLTPQQLSTLRGVNNFWSNANDILSIDYDVAETSRIFTLKKQIIAAAPHVITPSPASIQTFNTDMASPLKECKVHFSPVQEGTGDPSPENVRPITGWTGVEVYRAGKNLINPDLYTLKLQPDGINKILKSASVYGALSVPVPSGISLHFSKNTNVGSYFLYGAVEEAKIGSTYTGGWTATNYTNLTVTEQNNTGKYVYVIAANDSIITAWENVEAQVEIGEEKTSYEKPSGEKFIIDWSDSGTIYGGYVDLVKGEVVAEYSSLDLSTITGWISWGNGNYRSSQIANMKNIDWVAYPDNSLFAEQYKIVRPYDIEYKGATGIGGYQNTICSSVENPTGIIVYKLAEPIHYTIDPISLKTIRGTNNIWSNANGNIELSYWKH